MSKRKTTEQFIEDARAIHGDKYDYSKVEYVNSRTKVCIICPIHGEFFQEANGHIQGKKCYLCEQLRKRTKLCGIGVNDLDHPLSKKEMKSYYVWASMIRRCYDEKELKKKDRLIQVAPFVMNGNTFPTLRDGLMKIISMVIN